MIPATTSVRLVTNGQSLGFTQSGLFNRDQIIHLMRSDAKKKLQEAQLILSASEQMFEVIQESSQGRVLLPSTYGYRFPASKLIPNATGTIGVSSPTYKSLTASATGNMANFSISTTPDSADDYVRIPDNALMQTLDFSDKREGYWYYSSRLTDEGDVSLDISIERDSGAYDVEVIDEFTLQPHMYGRRDPETRDKIRKEIDSILAAMRGEGLDLRINHKEYGCEDTGEQADNAGLLPPRQ